VGRPAWTDNEEAVVWVEASLRYARDRNLIRLMGLLAAVRDEIALEMNLGPSHSLWTFDSLDNHRCM
jgi:hypothetical protein